MKPIRFHKCPQSLPFHVALTLASKSFLVVVTCSMGAVLLSQVATADSYTYDADTATAGAQDGSGLGWDAINPNWLLNGTGADVAWPNLITDTAVFGAGGTIANAAAGTVTVGTVNVGTISFEPTVTTGYTLAGGTITLGAGVTTTNTTTVGSTVTGRNSNISSVIAGSNGLAFNGTATVTNGLTLSGLNTYTGITSTSGGGRLSGTGATPFGSTDGATASTLGSNYTEANTGITINVANSTAEAFLISGTGSFPSGNAPGALRIVNGVTLSSLVQLGANAFLGGNFGVGTISGNVDLAGFTLTTGNGNNPLTLTLNGVVSSVTGGSLVIQTGSGSPNVINLNNASNSYSGNTQISGGTVVGTTLPSNGTLGLGGDAVLGTSTLVFAGGNIRSTNATPRTIANTIGNLSGNATFGELATQTGTLNFTSTAVSSLGGTAKTLTTHVDASLAASFSGTSNITKAGAARLTLTGDNIRTGTTTVSAGTLLINNTTGSGTGTGAVTITNLVGAVTTAEAGATTGTNSTVIGGVSNVTAGTLRAGQSITGTGIPVGTIITAVSIGTTTSSIQISKAIPAITPNVAFSTTAFNSAPVLGGTGRIAPTGANGLLFNSGSALGLVDGVIESFEVDLTATTGGATFDSGSTFAFELGNSTNSDSVAFTGLDDSALTLNGNVINLAATGIIDDGSHTYTLMTFSPDLAVAPALVLGPLPAGFSSPSLNQQVGKIELTVNYVSPLTPFEAFINSFPSITGANKLSTADPDGDGLTNQQEFAFGLLPDSGASVNPIVSPLNKVTGLFNYTRRASAVSGLVFTHESSTTLTNWVPFTPDSVTTNGGSPIEQVTVDVPNALLTNTKLFVRAVAK